MLVLITYDPEKMQNRWDVFQFEGENSTNDLVENVTLNNVKLVSSVSELTVSSKDDRVKGLAIRGRCGLLGLVHETDC